MRKLCYDVGFPKEFGEVLQETPVALVPFGLLEWHGKHLPLGNDGVKAYEICLRVAEKTGGVVLPPTYWGIEGLEMPGTLKVSLETGKALFIDIFRQLLRQGFKVVVAITGHYSREQVFVLKEAAEYVERMCNIKGRRVRVIAMPEYEVVPDLGYRGDHAAKWETSILLYLRPELVDMSRLDELTGVYGEDPRTQASRELGEKVVEAIVARIAEPVQKALEVLKP